MGKLQPERFEVIFSSENRLRFFFGNKVRDPLITYLLEREMLKFQISFKILKELVDDAYDQFLKDLKGNLKFQHLKNC